MTGSASGLALVLATTVPVCAPERPAASAVVQVIDDAGDTVRLAAPARRIVSLIPTTTEILVAGGLGARVVGRTEWCDWPDAATRIPSVGGGFPPNVEAVAARRPDLVIAYHTEATAPAAAQLRALGIAVLRLRTDRVSDIPRAAQLLGTLANEPAAMEALARDFTRSLAAASGGAAAKGARPIPVLLLAWTDPVIALGRGAFMSELLELAGGLNAFAELGSASAPISLEAIVERDPEMIFLADSAAGAS